MQQVLIHQIFLKKNDLANLKSDVDKLDIDKLKNVTSDLSNLKNKVDKTAVDQLVPAPVDLRKLRDLVKNHVAKKDVYNAEIKCIKGKISGITNLPFNTALNATINEVKNKVLSIINLVTNAFLNAKINMVKNEIPSATNIATTTTAFTAVDNKIPDHSKSITTPEFNKLSVETLTARLKQANLATKGDIVDFIKKTDFEHKLKSLNKKVT